MDIKDYTNPSGKLTDSGKGYHLFTPNPLPPKIQYDESLVSLLSETDGNFNRLAGMSLNLPNPYILMMPYIKKEAVLSSKIEGTKASLRDLFIYEAEQKKDKSDKENTLGLREISNYVNASERTLWLLKKGRELNLELLKYAHKILLRGVRGEDKNPGHFRVTQNAIVPYHGCPIEEYRFVPPPHPQVGKLMLQLQDFIENPPKNMPFLIQSALLHYQFETIHPFGDGNGRIGRLLIILHFYAKGNMPHAILYLSGFFDKFNKQYIDRLLKVSQESDWIGWIKYYLTAVNEQSKSAIRSVGKLIKLRERYREQLRKAKANENVKTIVTDYLFKNPYLTANNISDFLDVSHQTAIKIIKTLEKIGILDEHIKKRKRNRIYKAIEVIRIVENN